VTYDIVGITKRYKAELHEFFLDLKSWRKFNATRALSWQKVSFSKANQSLVPKTRGLYVFTIELAPSELPMHGYILYVGEAGHGSKSNLHVRYGQYIGHLVRKDGRPAVRYMLENWTKDLQFNYVALADEKIDLEKIERSFINAVIPPVNKRDLEAELKGAKAAKF
jgi:hypothetical protein